VLGSVLIAKGGYFRVCHGFTLRCLPLTIASSLFIGLKYIAHSLSCSIHSCKLKWVFFVQITDFQEPLIQELGDYVWLSYISVYGR